LLRFDPTDRTGTKVVGDLAESWTIAKDGRTYTFKLRRGVKFHDGSDLTSKDVKASYDKIVNPPADVISYRKGQYTAIEAIDAPDPTTVVFRLKWPGPLMTALASPLAGSKADILPGHALVRDARYGGGASLRGAEGRLLGRQEPEHWDTGKPYLDSYRALVIRTATPR
jgi:peptide/nickel transport system substrate-binding protein